MFRKSICFYWNFISINLPLKIDKKLFSNPKIYSTIYLLNQKKNPKKVEKSSWGVYILN